MMLANLGDVRGQLERGCDLQKSDGGFRMLEWMLSLGAIYRNCLANVRKVEQNGKEIKKNTNLYGHSLFFSFGIYYAVSSVCQHNSIIG